MKHSKVHRKRIANFGLTIQVGLLIGVLLSLSSGCQVFSRFKNQSTPVPIVLQNTATLDQLIAAVRTQSERVNQLKSDVRVTMPGAPTLRGDLQIERPGNLRLQAGVLGISDLGFDLGSNAEQFWIWKKAALPNDPPTLYFAQHDAYQQSALRQHLQLQPLWLIDALGLIEFHSDDQHSGPFAGPNGLVEIRSYSSSASRPALRRALIDPKRAIVVQQSFYDQQGSLVAYLDSIKHQYYPEQKVSLPHRIVINISGAKGEATTLTVDAGQFLINTLFGDPQLLWTMPNPADIRRVDLSGMTLPGDFPEQVAAPNERQTRNWSAPRY